MDAEIRALKIEIVEAVRRRLEGDRREGDHLIALQAVAQSLCDLISACAKNEEHRQSLIGIVNGMLQSCTTAQTR